MTQTAKTKTDQCINDMANRAEPGHEKPKANNVGEVPTSCPHKQDGNRMTGAECGEHQVARGLPSGLGRGGTDALASEPCATSSDDPEPRALRFGFHGIHDARRCRTRMRLSSRCSLLKPRRPAMVAACSSLAVPPQPVEDVGMRFREPRAAYRVQ